MYERSWTQYTAADCVQTYSGVDGANAGGHYQGTTSVFKLGFPGGQATYCSDRFSRPPGYILVVLQIYFYGGSPAQWRLCAATGNVYNTTSASSLNVETGPDAHPPCGPAYYQLLTWGMEANGTWQPANGGPVGSGQHWLQ